MTPAQNCHLSRCCLRSSITIRRRMFCQGSAGSTLTNPKLFRRNPYHLAVAWPDRCIAVAIFGMAAATRHPRQRLGCVAGALRGPVEDALPAGHQNVVNDLGYTALERAKVKEAIALFKSNVDAHPNLTDASKTASFWRPRVRRISAWSSHASRRTLISYASRKRRRSSSSNSRNNRWKRRNPGGTRSGWPRCFRDLPSVAQIRAALNSAA
jgi:hypothetical protein